MAQDPSSTQQTANGRLRVLETTDLHMQLLDYDYFADQLDPTIGLIGLADKISDLQSAPGIATILCDNGDLLQGNPLADHIANAHRKGDIHPMIAALNALGYDAMTLGNHEFDYGMDFLSDALNGAVFPVVCANITDAPALAKPFVILERDIECDDGQTRPIKIGITGFTPPQVEAWNDLANTRPLLVNDIVGSARKIVPQIGAAGADVVIALCHSGIGNPHHAPRMENAALPLAAVEGIDVLLLGHTHGAFPDPAIENTAEVDFKAARLRGKPAVMAEFCGKSLGVIDLELSWGPKGWQITRYGSYLAPAEPATEPESEIRQRLRSLVAEQHAAAIAQMQRPVAQTAIPITSYFATIQPDLSQQLLARAMQGALQSALNESEFAQLPVLAAKSSFRFGGRSGLGHYINIPRGPITLRDTAAIFPFADTLCAVRRTGAQLKLWLERAAAHYNKITPGQRDQALIHPRSAGYNCDTIFGLSYEIDLTQPARFDTEGQLVDIHASRIINIKANGAPVQDSDEFIVGTNSFRARGGGGFPAIAAEDIVYETQTSVREILVDYLKTLGTVTKPVTSTWSFAAIPQSSAVFSSAPAARAYLSNPLSYIGPGQDGFALYRISF